MRLRQLLTAILSIPLAAQSATISSSKVIEDFASLDYADLSLPSSAPTTGLWDIPHARARAHAFANGAAGASRPIDFGDGSDGAVHSTSGYTFNTDSHPAGFNFTSLSITGAITVTGSQPLVIRSLSTLQLGTLNLDGPDGTAGALSGSAITGPVTVTCQARGGFGGSASAVSGQNGGDGIRSDGTPEGAGNEGQGQTAPGSNVAAIDGQGSVGGPANNDFELDPAAFLCGAGGPGGGGYSDGAANFGSGGAGGAGGGRAHLVAVGDLSITAISARGGNGGNGVTAAAGPFCSGNGSAGNGGAIWLQTLGGLATTSNPDVIAGTSGTSACSIGSGQSLIDGFTRGDTSSTGARPAWAAGGYDTDVVPATLTSIVQSKAYPLGVLNAVFSAPTVVFSGSVSVEYAGSKDGTTFDPYVTDLTALSDHDYRFVRWRATLTNPGSPGASPTLTRVVIPFDEKGVTSVDLKLAAGCGTVAGLGPGGATRPWSPREDGAHLLFTAFGILLLFSITRLFRQKHP